MQCDTYYEEQKEKPWVSRALQVFDAGHGWILNPQNPHLRRSFGLFSEYTIAIALECYFARKKLCEGKTDGTGDEIAQHHLCALK